MFSQTDRQLPEGHPYPISEISKDGYFVTQNVPKDELQREVITDRDDPTFTAYVKLATCVHGTLTPGGDPASLIVFQYEIHCTQDRHVIKSLYTDFEFTNTTVGSPSVIAYGPHTQRKFNETTGEVNRSSESELNAGVGFGPAQGGLRLSVQDGTVHQQQYFDKVESGRHYNSPEKRHHTVWWRYSHNKDQNLGVPPLFRTAILLRRTDTSPFRAIFKLEEMDASLQYRAGRAMKKFFGKAEPDDAINFDPNAQPLLVGANIDSTSLGKLARDTMLNKNLSPIWGADIEEEAW